MQDYARSAVEARVSKMLVGEILTTESIVADLRSHYRGVSARSAMLFIKERKDMEYVSVGKWRKVGVGGVGRIAGMNVPVMKDREAVYQDRPSRSASRSRVSHHAEGNGREQ